MTPTSSRRQARPPAPEEAGKPAVAAPRKAQARSRVSNGKILIAGIDQRSTWVRRCKDLIDTISVDLGGGDCLSEARRCLIRRASVLAVECERLESKFALAGEANTDDLDLYQRCSGSLRRLLESIGIERKARDITPSLQEHLRTHYSPSDAEAGAR